MAVACGRYFSKISKLLFVGLYIYLFLGRKRRQALCFCSTPHKHKQTVGWEIVVWIDRSIDSQILLLLFLSAARRNLQAIAYNWLTRSWLVLLLGTDLILFYPKGTVPPSPIHFILSTALFLFQTFLCIYLSVSVVKNKDPLPPIHFNSFPGDLSIFSFPHLYSCRAGWMDRFGDGRMIRSNDPSR